MNGGEVKMKFLSPSSAQYANNFYNRPKSTHHTKTPVTREDFMEQLSETTKIFDLKKRALPGPIFQTELTKQKQKSSGAGSALTPSNKKILPPTNQDLFSQSELVLWSSCNWRRRDKNFGYFNKLSPIRETGSN